MYLIEITVHDDVGYRRAYLERVKFVQERVSGDNKAVRFGESILKTNRELELLSEDVANDYVSEGQAMARVAKILEPPLFRSARN